MKPSFSELPRPILVGSLRHRTAKEIADDIKRSEQSGAKAFILHIQLMDENEKSFGNFEKIAGSTRHPIMAIDYRTGGDTNDKPRLDEMREAVRAGFRSVDVPMYTYDPDPAESLKQCCLPFAAAKPKEVSMNSEVAKKQIALIDEFKNMGAEVLMSAHVGVELSCEQIFSLACEIRSRGADIVKIITSCESRGQQLEILRANRLLKESLGVPFICTCGGKFGRFVRLNAPFFGSMLVFGHSEYGELSNRQKPLLSDVETFFDLMGNEEK